jgi:hypothetical protein
MNLLSIRAHLRAYEIRARRATTVNHAFASAIAPVDRFSIDRVRRGVMLLGQDPDLPLRCVYCDESAETWDHLRGLVLDREFSGYGHVLGNLVPCCRSCNSRKGAKDWRRFLTALVDDEGEREERERRIDAYVAEFLPEPVSADVFAKRCPELMQEFADIRDQVIALLARADVVAAAIRAAVTD